MDPRRTGISKAGHLCCRQLESNTMPAAVPAVSCATHCDICAHLLSAAKLRPACSVAHIRRDPRTRLQLPRLRPQQNPGMKKRAWELYCPRSCSVRNIARVSCYLCSAPCASLTFNWLSLYNSLIFVYFSFSKRHVRHWLLANQKPLLRPFLSLFEIWSSCA
jgi:hypothetical protein